MVSYYGDFAEDETVYIPFNTFTSDDPSASVTISDLADADIKVHKDGHVDQIVTDGATVVIDFDSITGNHLVTIDTSAHSDYATGSEYQVRIEGTTVDGATINAWIGSFSIERAGGTIALLKLIQAAVITNAAGTDVAADIIAIKAETADIVADTNELQGDDIPGALSTHDGKLDTVDANVDQIETAVITNAAGTDIAADIIAVKTETANIVADTGELQTDDIPGALSTHDGKLDTVDANVDQIETAIITNAAGTDIAADIIAVKAETATIVADTNELQTDNIPGALSTHDGKLDTVDGIVDAIVADTGTDGVVLKAAGLNADAVDEILDEVIEGTITLRQAIRLLLAAACGKLSGGGTATATFRDTGDSTNRIVATVTADGNRTAVTLDET